MWRGDLPPLYPPFFFYEPLPFSNVSIVVPVGLPHRSVEFPHSQQKEKFEFGNWKLGTRPQGGSPKDNLKTFESYFALCLGP